MKPYLWGVVECILVVAQWTVDWMEESALFTFMARYGNCTVTSWVVVVVAHCHGNAVNHNALFIPGGQDSRKAVARRI